MKVITPKPRKAKKVSATLETISPPRRIAGERQQVEVQVGQRGDREDREDADHDDDHQRLCPRHDVRPQDVQARHHQQDQDREEAGPASRVVDGRAGVVPERHRHHGGDDRVDGEHHPGDDAREVPLPPPADHVLQEPACRGVASAHFRERVALQRSHHLPPGGTRSTPRAGHLAGRTQQREDPRADHRADTDERGVAHRQGPLGLVDLCRARSVSSCHGQTLPRQVERTVVARASGYDAVPTSCEPAGWDRTTLPGRGAGGAKVGHGCQGARRGGTRRS